MLFVSCGIATSTHNDASYTPDSVVSPPPKKIVKFMGVGDNLVHPNIFASADLRKGVKGDGLFDFSHFFESIQPEIKAADISFINVETISGGDELGYRGYPSFNSPRQLIHDIEKAGFNLISMANNHCLDTGVRGIYHALYNWGKTSCVVSGVNADEDEREAIKVFEKNGIRFAFLAYTSHTNGIPADKPWRVNYMNEDQIRIDIEKAKKLADFVIVSAHWGQDDVFALDAFQIKYANLFAELGVDVVIGTGPHVLQPIQWIEKNGHRSLVVFSLANYISGMRTPFNEITGAITFDFAIDVDYKGIENVVFVPLVMHKEADVTKNTLYKLENYTEELALRHMLRAVSPNLNINYFNKILKEQIGDKFLKK